MERELIHQLTKNVYEIVLEAGEIAHQFFLQATTKKLRYHTKNDNTLVSEADFVLNSFIQKHLTQLTANIPIVSEENTQTAYEKRKNWNTLWMVDPLDGTRHFVNGNPDYSINIALIHNTKPIVGVVYAPSHKRGYKASQGSGAWKINELGNSRQIYTTKHANAWLDIMISHGVPGWRLRRFVAKQPASMFIRMGSALKTCWIAEGKADIYPRFGITYEWDTAAAQIILEEAGGCICDNQGKALSYNKPQLQNPEFIAKCRWYQPPHPWY